MKHCIECHKLFSPRNTRQVRCGAKECDHKYRLRCNHKRNRTRSSGGDGTQEAFSIPGLPPVTGREREYMLERFLSYILTPQEQVQVIFQDAQRLGQHYHRGEMA